MLKKFFPMLFLALILTVICCYGSDAKNMSPKPLKWKSTNYEMLLWELDKTYTTVYQDSIKITLDYGGTIPPIYFNLYPENPHQFFSATFDSNEQIINCIFQEGIKFSGLKNSQWPGSLLRSFLADSLNTKNLENKKVAHLLKKAFDYLENSR